MQINPLFISLWIIQVFALLFGARELNKIIRKVENANVYWPVEERDDPSHGRQRLLYDVGVNPWRKGIPLTDQHHRRSNTFRNGDPVKPTPFTPEKEVREPKKSFIFAHSWAHFLRDELTGGEGWAADCVADCWWYWQIYYQLFIIRWGI